MKRIKAPDALKTRLSFYTSLPTPHLDYETFREYSIERIKMLRRIENKVNDTYSIKNVDDDIIQHFCLKLVCSQTKWALKWFINNETELFRLRINTLQEESRTFFLNEFWPHYKTNGELITFDSFYDPEYNNQSIYNDKMLIHFSKVPDILAKRNFDLKNGYFEYNLSIMKSLLVTEFRNHLLKTMNELYDKCVYDPDERLQSLNTEIFMYKRDDKEQHSDVLSKSDSFPLCIRGVIDVLKTKKHLKYNDRTMLSLFFKDLGMPINDTVEFFRNNFVCPPDKFNKEYLYNIRHNYGLEGKRANYNCLSCPKISSFSYDPGSYGCPFVNKKDYVLNFVDLEDLDKDPFFSCTNFASKLVGEAVEPVKTPADFFRKVRKGKK